MTRKLFLIVEDHPAMAEMIGISLKQLEPLAHCIIAENPDQAKERLDLETPDLLTLDLMFKTIGERKNSSQPALNLLKHIFQTYPKLNILVYSTEPGLIAPVVKEAQSHQGGFVVVDKQLPPKDFTNKARVLFENQGIKLIPSDLTQELDGISLNHEQKKILELACKDCLTDQLIADKLNVSRKTVQNQMQYVRNQLNIFANRNERDLRMLMCYHCQEKGLI
jgi:DNA-binding NarL/FixJ family response regulator